MKCHFVILAFTCTLIIGCASVPSGGKASKPTARDIVYNSCLPVEFERGKEKYYKERKKGEGEETKAEEVAKSYAHYLCTIASGVCTESFAKNKDSCTRSLRKYDEALRKTGNSLLHQAAYYGLTDLVKIVMEIGVDLNMQASGLGSTPFGKGWTPLMYAAAEGHGEVVSVLIQGGADVNAKNDLGRTALMFSSNYGYNSIAKDLLTHGANPNIIPNDEDGWTALIAAASKGNVNTVTLLLEYGADASLKDRNGKTALAWAEEQGYLEIAHILRE